MRVVLREAADAHQAVEHAALLIAVHGAEFGPAARKFAVGTHAALVDLDVERAVHGLGVVVELVDLHRGVHALLVESEVSAGLPELAASDMRRVQQVIAVRQVLLAPEGLDDVADVGSFRVPQHEAGADHFGDAEEVEFLAEAAVVAFLGFLDPLQIGFQLLLVRERRPVNALEHRVLLVAAVVGARHGEQLECADLVGVRHVRAAAQVGEVAADVERDLAVVRDVGEAFELVVLAASGEERVGVFAGHDLAFERQMRLCDLLHFRLDLREVVGGEARFQVEVVVEAVLGRGTDVEFRVRVEFLHRRGHHVGRAVPDRFQRVFSHLSFLVDM